MDAELFDQSTEGQYDVLVPSTYSVHFAQVMKVRYSAQTACPGTKGMLCELIFQDRRTLPHKDKIDEERAKVQ